MNFGLLCDDPAASALIAAFRHSPAHRLTRAVLVSPDADELLHGVPGVQFAEHWEDLLTARDVEAVIVGGASADVWEGAKQLASASIPLLVLPTIADGATLLYELSLIRDDRRSVLCPAWLHRFDPAVLRWREQLRAGDHRRYVHWEREIAGGAGREISRAAIDEALFRDADLWRFLAGGADQVTALQTGGTATGALIQSIVLVDRSAPELTWTMKSGEADISRLTLPAEQGETRLEFQGNSLESAERLLDAFAATVAGNPAACDWTEVLHAAEIVDAAHRSLERRRTIDLHHEALSERAIFKTQMTALGCSALMLTLCVLVVCLAVDSIAPLHSGALKLLVVLLCAPLFVFLLVQALLPLTRTAGRAER
jgi:predicted dehydrogenase